MGTRGVLLLITMVTSVASPCIRLYVHYMLPHESRETTLCNVINMLHYVYTYRFRTVFCQRHL